jgi:hypothetical protein
LYVLAVVCLAVGCSVVESDQVSPDTVYMSWWGQYNEDQGRMQWSASYFVGGSDGTYLELTGRSSSTVNGQGMVENRDILNQIAYEWSAHASPASTYELQYVDTAGAAYTNDVSLPPAVGIDPRQSPVVSLAAGVYFVTWESQGALDQDDEIEATISAPGVTITASADPVGSLGQLRFGPDQLAQLQPGTARLQICVTREGSLPVAPPEGGDVSVSYCSSSLVLRVDR